MNFVICNLIFKVIMDKEGWWVNEGELRSVFLLQVLSVLHSNQVQRRGIENLTVISTMSHFSEPLVESIPQFFIMIYIIINNRNGDTISFDNFFWSSFASSVFSSAFVLTKQLKVGPCQLMPRDKFGLTFMLIFFCNIFGLLGKGCLLNVWGSYMKIRGFGVSYGPIMMIITSILPPMTFVSKTDQLFCNPLFP